MEDECQWHPGNPSGVRCQPCYDEYQDYLAAQEDAYREERA